MDVQESVLFLRGRLNEGLYYGHKSKGYATEVVTATEKLPPDDPKDIKDNSGEAQNQQDSDRDKKQKAILKKVPRSEKGQEYASVLPSARANKQLQKPRV